jgi:hypothetical protein
MLYEKRNLGYLVLGFFRDVRQTSRPRSIMAVMPCGVTLLVRLYMFLNIEHCQSLTHNKDK